MTCVYCCRTKDASKNLKITFHNFPKNHETKKAWVEACVSRGCEFDANMKTIKLCSVHFTVTDYDEANKAVRTFLKKGAVPSRFWKKPYMHCIVCSDVGCANCDVYLHAFPEDSMLRKQWINACNQNGFHVKCVYQPHRICSKHFSPDCFTAIDKRHKFLKLDAVPVVFPLPTSADPRVQQSENVIASAESDENKSSVDVRSCSVVPARSSIASESVASTSAVMTKGVKRPCPCTYESVSSGSPETPRKIKVWRPARVGDLREEHFNTPREAKRHFHMLFNKCKEYKSKIALFRTRTWRLQSKIKYLENVTAQLSDKNLIATMEVPSEVLPKLVCKNCGGYLSRGPVHLMDIDKYWCGRCLPSEEEQGTRIKAYEDLARLMTFPCRYQENGCTSKVPFAENEAHEEACLYRKYICPIAESGQCEWTGIQTELLEHCRQQHPDNVVENPCTFTHNITRSSLHNYLLWTLGVLFLIQTKVCTVTRKIYHSVRLIGDPANASDYKYTLYIQNKDSIFSKHRQVAPCGCLALQHDSAIQTDINGLLAMLEDMTGTTFTVTVESTGNRTTEALTAESSRANTRNITAVVATDVKVERAECKTLTEPVYR